MVRRWRHRACSRCWRSPRRSSPATIRSASISINSLQPPSLEHWFGTDIQGRDVWARLVYGARVSLSVGIVSQGISLTLGVILGLIAGYYGRWVDELVMRLADVTLAFPDAAAAHRARRGAAAVAHRRVRHDRRRRLGGHGAARSRTGARRSRAGVRAGRARARRART